MTRIVHPSIIFGWWHRGAGLSKYTHTIHSGRLSNWPKHACFWTEGGRLRLQDHIIGSNSHKEQNLNEKESKAKPSNRLKTTLIHRTTQNYFIIMKTEMNQRKRFEQTLIRLQSTWMFRLEGKYVLDPNPGRPDFLWLPFCLLLNANLSLFSTKMFKNSFIFTSNFTLHTVYIFNNTAA